MDQQICPLRRAATATQIINQDTPCIRERCAWWCPALTEKGEQHGACAITLKALSTCVIATYYEKIMNRI